MSKMSSIKAVYLNDIYILSNVCPTDFDEESFWKIR